MIDTATTRVVDVTTHAAVFEHAGVRARIPWGVLRSAAAQADRELATLYGVLLARARAHAAARGLARLEIVLPGRRATVAIDDVSAGAAASVGTVRWCDADQIEDLQTASAGAWDRR